MITSIGLDQMELTRLDWIRSDCEVILIPIITEEETTLKHICEPLYVLHKYFSHIKWNIIP